MFYCVVILSVSFEFDFFPSCSPQVFIILCHFAVKSSFSGFVTHQDEHVAFISRGSFIDWILLYNKTNVCHWAVFLLFALPDLSFITTWPFLWKVSAITLVSCLPLYIIKYLKRKFSPPSYSKLSSWAKLGLPCFVVSCFTERSVFSTFFTHWSSVTGKTTCGGKGTPWKNGKLGEIKTIFFGLCHWDLGMTWKKKHIKKKTVKGWRRRVWRVTDCTEKDSNTWPHFVGKRSICLLLLENISNKSASSVILYTSDALFQRFSFYMWSSDFF